ncbi:hypothetical protein [Weissella confusa]|uniref:hypothetical protein n=1 Tax=Weissella confusa TaxID=1583 RepID=UPI0015F55FAC|nr:hypothetical protein [Weissella confusa]MBA5932948.1 hypothetical protein [Weissella confusa]
MKARKKPIAIDVWQVPEGDILDAVAPTWVVDAIDEGMIAEIPNSDDFAVNTLEGRMIAHVGDYLAKGIDGELYPIAKDIFERTYDVIDGDE